MRVLILFLFLSANAYSAPVVEAIGDMTVMLFNPSAALVTLNFGDTSVLSGSGGVKFDIVEQDEVPDPFVVSVTGATEDPFVYVDPVFPGLLMDWSNGVQTSCTNCILSPIPLPPSLMLFIFALAGLGLLKRRSGYN